MMTTAEPPRWQQLDPLGAAAEELRKRRSELDPEGPEAAAVNRHLDRLYRHLGQRWIQRVRAALILHTQAALNLDRATATAAVGCLKASALRGIAQAIAGDGYTGPTSTDAQIMERIAALWAAAHGGGAP
jgi:hypothetical protein